MDYVGIPATALLADVDEFDIIGVQRKSIRLGWKIDNPDYGKSPFWVNSFVTIIIV